MTKRIPISLMEPSSLVKPSRDSVKKVRLSEKEKAKRKQEEEEKKIEREKLKKPKDYFVIKEGEVECQGTVFTGGKYVKHK